jgi:hypothetical protein
MDRWSFMRFAASSSDSLVEPASRVSSESGTRLATGGTERAAAQERFLRELALHTDGIGGVHLLHCLSEHGVWAFLAEQGSKGATLLGLARRFGGNLGYLNVVFRSFALQGWVDWQPRQPVDQTHIMLTEAGRQLLGVLARTDGAAAIVRFLPVATQMARELFGGGASGRHAAPAFATLVERNSLGWSLGSRPAEAATNSEASVAERFRLALEGNLIGPVVVALKDEFYPGLLGAWLERWPRTWQRPRIAAWARRRQRAQLLDAFQGPLQELDLSQLRGQQKQLRLAFELLRDVGWVELEGPLARLTTKGRYAATRAWGYGVPVSYLPMFGQLDALLFGDHRRVLAQVPGKPEAHLQRRLNVKASGSSHRRYFAAADEVVLRAFNLPFPEQPRGFADMGSGDGSWLQHIWELIQRRTERGRLMREFPQRLELQPLMVGLDYNQAARRATSERLTRAGVPHLVLFGDINDPEGVRTRLSEHGVDARELLHGSSFLIHNRPYQAPKQPAQAARRHGAATGAYVAAGLPIESADLQQNLVEFFRAWSQIIGQHGMLAIELHDPERVVIGKTLTNYMLTHGLSDQLTVGIAPFLAAAGEAGLEVDPAHQRLFPAQRELATVSVNHFRRASGAR